MRQTGLLIVVVALLALAGSAAAADGGRPFSTALTGEAEVNNQGVPNQGDLDGSGEARLTLNHGQGEICFELAVSGVAPILAAHIHAAPAGSNGPVVVPLVPPTSGFSSGCVDVAPDLVKAIIQNPAAYYVNVHNADYPAGALRGQLGK